MSRLAARIWHAAPRAVAVAPRAVAVRGVRTAALAAAVQRAPRRVHARAFHASNPALAPFQFKLADIGEGITEVEVIKWVVKVGDTVEEFDPLCEVQSDKSVVEITSPYSGKIVSLAAEAGKVIKVGSTLIELDMGDNAPEEDSHESHSEPEAAPERRAEPEPVAEEPKAAPPPPPVATSSSGRAPRAPRPHPLSDTAVRFEGEASVLPAAPPPRHDNIPDHVPERRAAGDHGGKVIIRSSPAVRAFAGRLGIELEEVTPSGPGGRVTREDVQRFADELSAPSASRSAPAPKAASSPAREERRSASAPAPVSSPVDRGEASERMEMGRTRKVMYKAMGSMGSVPHFGYQHTLDLTNILPLMKAANAQPAESKTYLAADVPSYLVHPAPTPARTKTSVLPFLVKALALALEEHPIMRARVKEAEGERWLEVSRDANIGIAVSDPKLGLLTPSLTGLDPAASVSTVNDALAQLRKNAARPGALPHVTLSSVGPLGEARGAMPVLPPGGGLAIAAVGRAAWEVEWALRNGGSKGVWNLDPAEVQAGGTRAALKCPVAWSGDHRVLEGAELIAFTETWKRYVEEPWRWIQV